MKRPCGNGCGPASRQAEDTAPSGTVELADAATARLVWPAVHDVARRQRVGEISAQKDRWADLSDVATGTDGPLRYLVHRSVSGEVDGIANYRLPWSSDMTVIGTLVVEALEATTPDAYSALWWLLTDFDLTRRVVAATRPADEPLRWMLKNPLGDADYTAIGQPVASHPRRRASGASAGIRHG